MPGPDKLTKQRNVTGSITQKGPDGKPVKTMKVEGQVIFSNWQVGKPLDDALFKPPAGYKITESPTPPPVPGMKRP